MARRGSSCFGKLKPRVKSRFLKDKIEAELQVRRFGKDHPECMVTVLRPCTVLGPTFKSYATRFFGRRKQTVPAVGFGI